MITIGFGIAPHVHAHYASDSIEREQPGALSTHEQKNSGLESGQYDFAQLHLQTGKTFNDLWGFSLAEDSIASISIFDLELPLGDGASTLKQFGKPNGAWHGKKYGHDRDDSPKYWPSSGKLLDNKFLSFSLFDDEGNLLGSAGENGTLSNLALHAGEWYTLSVSAQIKGIFGSAYHGSLNVTPSAVPLGDSLPFFASALGLLGLRYRKRLQLQR